MQVAINARFLLPNRLEGIGRYTYEIVQRMALNHPEVTFHLLFDRPFSNEFLMAPNMMGHSLGPSARHPWLWYYHYEVRVKRWLKQHQVDLYWGPDAFLAESPSKTKSVVTIHDLAWEHRPEWNAPRVSRFYSKWVPRYCERADHIISISDFTRHDLVSRYGLPSNKITTIMHGYDEKKSIDKLVEWQRIPLFDPYFLALGSINPRKNSYNLLKAFIDYKDEGKITSDLVFAGVLGKGWSRKERSFITACFRRSDVHYLGRVSESEKDALLFNANALVYPSLLEGFGLVLLEAAQFNCPVLTSESSVCQEVLTGYTNQEGVIYIDPYSPERIGQGLTEVERIQKGPSLERNRTWDEVACELWEVLIGKINE